MKHAYWIDYRPRRVRRLIEKYYQFSIYGKKDKAQQWSLEFLYRVFWFESVRDAFQARLAAELGKQLDPDRYLPRSETDGPVRDKRMERLALGEHRIPREYFERVAKQKPGAEAHYPPVLFRALDTSTPIGNHANELLHLTSLRVQQLIFHRDGHRRRKGEIYQRLARHANTEGVAAMVILFRECCEKGLSQRCIDLGRHLYFMALTWCARYPMRHVLWEIAFYLERFIFPLAQSKELCLEVDWVAFVREVNCLGDYVFQLNWFPVKMRNNVHDGPSPDWEKFADGDWGMGYQWGLGPPLALRKREDSSLPARRAVVFCRVLKTWGWRSLRLFEPDSIPSISVYTMAWKNSITQEELDSLETEEELATFFKWTASPLRQRKGALSSDSTDSSQVGQFNKRDVERQKISQAYTSWRTVRP